MKISFFLFTVILFQSSGILAQSLKKSKSIDTINTQKLELEYATFKITSQVLNEEREIRILLPNDYSEQKKYPVVYITDGAYNFDMASFYLSQLIKHNAIPQTILIGVSHKNRGEELDVFWTENGIKFKDFLFKELVPYVNEHYSTSSFNTIIGHSDGAEYNHLLMLEEDNPFRGFINISENLNNDVSQSISRYFETYEGQKLYYFIATASYDSPDRIAAGSAIEKSFKENRNEAINFLNKSYVADHQNVLSKSLLDGISYVFQDYRNLSGYEGFKDYTENYREAMKDNYGLTTDLDINDVDYFFGTILDNKDVAMYEYIVEYVTQNNIFEVKTYDKSWHYYDMKQYSKSIEYWNKTVDNFEGTSPRVFYYNFDKAIDAYLVLKNPKGALEFLQKCKKVLPEYTLEFNYFIAKVALENRVQKSIGKRSLEYCKDNFKENKYFTKEDLDKLEAK